MHTILESPLSKHVVKALIQLRGPTVLNPKGSQGGMEEREIKEVFPGEMVPGQSLKMSSQEGREGRVF